MSQYLNVFIRHNDEFIPVASYSRSTVIYGLFNEETYAPYEKVSAYDKETLEHLMSVAENRRSKCQADIDECKEKLSLIMSANNSLEEKMEYLECYQSSMEESKDEQREYDYAIDFIVFLMGIIDEVIYGEHKGDADKLIYIGIECSEPTLEDIVG